MLVALRQFTKRHIRNCFGSGTLCDPKPSGGAQAGAGVRRVHSTAQRGKRSLIKRIVDRPAEHKTALEGVFGQSSKAPIACHANFRLVRIDETLA